MQDGSPRVVLDGREYPVGDVIQTGIGRVLGRLPDGVPTRCDAKEPLALAGN